MKNTVGRYSDRAMLDPDIAASGTSPRSLTNGSVQVASTGATETAITSNFKSALQIHADAGSDLNDVVGVAHPTTLLTISTVLTSGGHRAFPDVGVRGGTMFGVPILSSVGAVCSGSPSERVVAFINAAGVIVADEGDIEITASAKTAVQMDNATTQNAATATATAVVSMFQAHAVAIRFIRRLNFIRSHDSAVSFMRVQY
jgi:hypothetical protein